MSTLVVGVPSEIKDNENRVALHPDGVVELVHDGHQVLVQAGAGIGSRFPDERVRRRRRQDRGHRGRGVRRGRPDRQGQGAGARRSTTASATGQQLFTYLHLAADRGLTEFLLERRIDSIAYETVQTADGKLPLLTPMSEVAGRMAVQAAAHHLESPAGGAGILLGGVPGTPAAKVLIIGGGVSGTEAAKIALGMRAIVRVLDTNPARLAYLSDIFGGRLDLVTPNRARTAAYVAEADVVIGAVLVPGREGAEAGHPRDDRRDAAGQRGRRHRHRPGRLLRDQPPDHPLRPHLRRGGRHPLLRGQHPRRGRPHLDAGADLGHAALPGPRRAARRRRRGRRPTRRCAWA